MFSSALAPLGGRGQQAFRRGNHHRGSMPATRRIWPVDVGPRAAHRPVVAGGRRKGRGSVPADVCSTSAGQAGIVRGIARGFRATGGRRCGRPRESGDGRDLPDIGLFGWSARRHIADVRTSMTAVRREAGARRCERYSRTRPHAVLQVGRFGVGKLSFNGENSADGSACVDATSPMSSAGCRSSRPDADVYCGLSQVPTFLPESFIVMFVPWVVAWIAPA